MDPQHRSNQIKIGIRIRVKVFPINMIGQHWFFLNQLNYTMDQFWIRNNKKVDPKPDPLQINLHQSDHSDPNHKNLLKK
jgi:hypothetical protein